jgi:hypothetical protein
MDFNYFLKGKWEIQIKIRENQTKNKNYYFQ